MRRLFQQPVKFLFVSSALIAKIGETLHFRRHVGRTLEGSGREKPTKLQWNRLFGIRQERTFRVAATKYLDENQHKRSLERDARALSALHPYIGDLPLRRVHHDDTLLAYVRARLGAGTSPAPSTATWRWCGVS